jgi:hypothetical protein
MTTCRIGDVHFGWNEMTSNLMIRDARFHALDIDHGKIGDLDLYEVYTDRITINSAQIEGIKFVDVAGSQSFLQSSFSNDCSIKCSEGHSKIDAGGDLTITGCTFNKPLRISDKSVSFRVVNIDCSDTITGAIIFKQCSIVDLNFSGTNTSADLAFSRVHLQNIRITNFTNRNALAFSGCTVADSSILYIGGSDLGEARFLEHDFSRYTDVKIQHSFISEIKFASCKWFAFGKLETDAEDKNKSKRETFRQLKQAAERQNDRIQSLIFQAEELRQHEEELKVANRVLSRDYLTLWLMRQTNSYGLDWGKPLWLLFIVTTVFFVPMAVYASPKLSWASIEFWDGVKVIAHNRIALFVQLFNPARNPFTFVDKDNVHPAYFILDGIHRIIAAFLIVQIVSAFRKYIR